MRIFITGATGFIGRHVVHECLAAGHEVVGLARRPPTEHVDASERVRWQVGSLSDFTSEHFTGAEGVIHLASHGVTEGMNDWEKCFQVNVHDSLKLWRSAIDAGVRRFVICGSCFEYGRSGERYDYIPVDASLEPTGAYHSSKAAATMAALGLAVDYKLKLIVLRPFHIFGEGEAPSRFWSSLRVAAESGSDFKMTAGGQIRDFTPVELAAKAFVTAASSAALKKGSPRIVNLGAGRPTTLAQFAAEWWKKWGAKGKLIFGAIPYRPNEVMRYVPLIGEGERM